MTTSDRTRRARTAFWWVGVIGPLALLGLAAALVLTWLPKLPETVATHWSADGPDGFGSRISVVVPLLIAAGIVVALAALALVAHRLPSSGHPGVGGTTRDDQDRPQWSTTARFLGAVNLGLAAMFAVLTIATTAAQRGLDDAADAPSVNGWAAVSLAVLVAATVVGWIFQPKVRIPAPKAAEATAAPVTPSSRLAWFGTVSVSRTGQIALGAIVLVTIGLTVFMFARGESTAAAWTLAATAALLLGLGSTLVFRVRVGADGLRVRSLLGWPSTHIPLAQIAKVEIAQVNPFADFGGWGWRVALDGRRGVVLRAGEALQVTQTDDKVFVVTVEGATEAAAVLEGLRTSARRS